MEPTGIKLRGRPTILIVEDDASQRRLLGGLICEAFDCEVLEAGDGLEALRLLSEAKDLPSVILLDLILPYLNGAEFLRIIQGRAEFSEIPVVVCTAVDETSQIRGQLGHRIAGYLVKPISRAKLLQRLLSALGEMTFRIDFISKGLESER